MSTVTNTPKKKPNFRGYSWGNTKRYIIDKEKGKAIHKNIGETLIYNTQHRNVPVQLIFCFKNQNGVYRLRAAGYITNQHVENEKLNRVFLKEIIKKYGEHSIPAEIRGKFWYGEDTVVYAREYIGVSVPTNTIIFNTRTDTNLPFITSKNSIKRKFIFGYFEKKFYDQIMNLNDKSLFHGKLSYFEEILLGFRPKRLR